MSRLADELLMWSARHPQELLGDRGGTLVGKVKKLARECIELEQQLAELNDIETEWKKMLARAGDLRLALDVAEAKLTEQDKLLDECEEKIEEYVRGEYPFMRPLLTKLRDRNK